MSPEVATMSRCQTPGGVRAGRDPSASASRRANHRAPWLAPARIRRAIGPASYPRRSARAPPDRTAQRPALRRTRRITRARGIQSSSSQWIRCATTMRALHVFSPSLVSVHISGKPRSSASSAAGVRSSSAIVFSRFCSIQILPALLFPAPLSDNNGLRTFGSQADAGGLLGLD